MTRQDDEEPIRTARLTLEPLRVEHAGEMAGVLADPALYAFTGGAPVGVAELRERYRRQTAGSGDPAVCWRNWVVRLRAEDRLTGYVQATVDHRPAGGPVAELAWVIGTRRQGRGIATEAARALAGALAGQGVRVLVAHIHPEHRASGAVAAAAGLAPTDRWEDGERRWELRLPPADQPTTRQWS